ncbi:MAG: hypothetical protein HC902_03785 [Calothrix sp. SM1_5_4]|nr:hypothetical protein [Calothrix sp. SM1_5_4]
MFRTISTSLFIILVLSPGPAQAQLDGSGTVLLRPSGITVSPESLDSSRYKVRAPESKLEDDDDLDERERPGPVVPPPVPAPKPVAKKSSSPQSQPQPQPQPPPQPPAPSPATAEDERPTVSSQFRDLILGGRADEIEEVRKSIHPEDPRKNVLSITLAPAYYYNGSESGYSYRRFHSHGPGFGLGMNLWATPFFGIQSRFFSTVTASLRSGGTNMVPTEIQAFEAGIRFRKHFGYSRKAAQLSWGLDYHDSMNKISREATTVVGRKSSGISLAVEGLVPSSPIYAHSFELGIRPRLRHSDLSTGVDVVSGTNNETNAISFSVGGEWTLDRRNQVFWKGQLSVERNLFGGQANTADPSNGQSPNGVSVTNSLTIFLFLACAGDPKDTSYSYIA